MSVGAHTRQKDHFYLQPCQNQSTQIYFRHSWLTKKNRINHTLPMIYFLQIFRLYIFVNMIIVLNTNCMDFVLIKNQNQILYNAIVANNLRFLINIVLKIVKKRRKKPKYKIQAIIIGLQMKRNQLNETIEMRNYRPHFPYKKKNRMNEVQSMAYNIS